MTGRSRDQSTDVPGLLGEALSGAGVCRNGCPLFVPSAAVMNGVANGGGAGLREWPTTADHDDQIS